MPDLTGNKERAQMLNMKEPIFSITDQDDMPLLDISIRNDRLHMEYDKERLTDAARAFLAVMEELIPGNRVVEDSKENIGE